MSFSSAPGWGTTAPGYTHPSVPYPMAFPPMAIGTYQQANAKRAANTASRHFTTPRNARAAKWALKKNAEYFTGSAPGTGEARFAPNGSVYVGVGRTTSSTVGPFSGHYSGHPTSPGHPNTASGSHHVKFESPTGAPLGVARNFPSVNHHTGVPSFGRFVTPVPATSSSPGFYAPPIPAGSRREAVAVGLGRAFNTFAKGNPSGFATSHPGHPARPNSQAAYPGSFWSKGGKKRTKRVAKRANKTRKQMKTK
jgi:hypothetical protein